MACAFAILVLGIYASGGSLLAYFDIPSVLCVVGGTIAMLRAGYGFREMGDAFRAALSSGAERSELEKAELFFGEMRGYLYVSGLLSAFLGFIALFAHFSAPERFLPNIGVAIIVLFYALLLDFLLALPLLGMVRRSLREAA
jgi:flagellar motor component MotA